MEFIAGVDLRKVLRQRGALPPEEAFDVSIQIADGLQAIHDEGIVHRDLKTPNLMRDSRGVVRLMDFGIAKEWEGESSTNLTVAGQIVGTPEYMSPEQIRGEKIDSRSDIYTLGIVIFELFTGQVPFHGDTPMVTLFQHLEDPPPLEGPWAAKLPKALIPILRKALAKEAADRYASAREMAEALSQAQGASLPVTGAVPFTRPSRTATAQKIQPEPAVTPVPTDVPTQQPTLTPRPAIGAPSESAPTAVPTRAEATKSPGPTVPVILTQEGEARGPTHRAGHSAQAPTSTPPPSALTTIPRKPLAAEPAMARGERPRPQTPPPRPRPVTLPLARWLPAGLAVGIVLAVGAAVLLVRPRTPSEGVTSSPGVGVSTPTTAPSAPQAIAQSPGAGTASSISPTPLESVSGLVTMPSPVPKTVPTPAVGGTPEPAAPGKTATRADRPATSVTPPTPKPAPSARPIVPPRAETPTSSELNPPATTPPLIRGAEASPPTPASPAPATAAPAQVVESGLAAPSTPALEAPGTLVLKVKPWADVTIDGRVVGRNLPPKVSLSPGPHTLVLSHPDFEPFKRILTIRSGETSTLAIDLKDEAVRRKH
jgi:eukaryotic-like serine/threonine-protein kinase